MRKNRALGWTGACCPTRRFLRSFSLLFFFLSRRSLVPGGHVKVESMVLVDRVKISSRIFGQIFCHFFRRGKCKTFPTGINIFFVLFRAPRSTIFVHFAPKGDANIFLLYLRYLAKYVTSISENIRARHDKTAVASIIRYCVTARKRRPRDARNAIINFGHNRRSAEYTSI